MSLRPKTPLGFRKLFRETPGTPPTDDDDISGWLTALHVVADSKLSDLDGDASAALAAVKAHAKKTYDAPSYPEFYRQATKMFSDITKFKSGTVASYFRGCEFDTALTPAGCSLICASALPRPLQDGTGGPCTQHVFLGSVHEGSYTFETLLAPEGSSGTGGTGIVFVAPGFQGFSPQEKQWLAKRVDAVSVYEVDNNHTYTAALPLTPLGELQRSRTRALVSPGQTKAPEVVSTSYMSFIILGIIALLIILLALHYAGVRFYKPY